ncbi:MAG: DUF1573 domain-containing protein [Planctomycetota bacterium]|jgi:hypothetical protein
MKRSLFKRYDIIFVIGCILLMQICCQEQLEGAKASKSTVTESKPALTESKPALVEAQPQNPTTATAAVVSPRQEPAVVQTASKENKSGPEITFESLIHDFGEVGVNTRNNCEFKFKNTGDALLKISKVYAPCGCTVPELTKKQYAPGESGILKATYRAGSKSGSTSKRIEVSSNDKAKPKVILTLKAKIVMKVAYEPERLNLLLKGEKAGCPEITLNSRDNRAFSITSFKSTGDSITAEFDPTVKSTKFVLKPTVDQEKLKKGLKGQVEIGLTHPLCKKVAILFDTLAEFKIDPRVVYVREAEPQKPVTKKVMIFSNYNEDVEVESTSSKKGTVKVQSKEKVRNGYQLELQITPPALDAKRRVFTDVFTVKLKGGPEMQITCYGIYTRTPTKTSSE